MGTFNKLKRSSKSSHLDEKIEFLNKELKKTGVVCEDAPANSTAGIYNIIDFTAGLPEIRSDVPDSTGFIAGTSTQDANGGDESDSDTWENGWNNTTEMSNPNDLNGETNRSIPITPDLSGWDGKSSVSANNLGSGGYRGIAAWTISAGIGGGRSIGTIDSSNHFIQILIPSNIGSTYNYPADQSGSLSGGYYGGYSDREFEAAQNIASAYEANKTKGAVTRKVWVNYGQATSYGGPSYDAYTGAKKQTTGNYGQPLYWKLIDVAILNGARQNYISQNSTPDNSTVIFSAGLGDGEYYPGPTSGFMDFLKGALGVGKQALDWLMDAAGETADKLSNLPSVEETPNKIDDAVLAGLNNLNNILDKVNNNPIADALSWFGGNKQGETIGNFINAAADQVVQHTFGANSATQYAVQLATKLTASIADGRSHEIKLTGKAKKERINALDLDRLDGNITFGTPDASVDNAVTPGNKQPFLTGSWGKEGGQEVFYDKDTDTFTILSNKMLRTGAEDTSASDNPFTGGDTTDQYDSKGNIIRFGDVPSATAAELEWADTILADVLDNAPPKIQKIIDLMPNTQLLDEPLTRKYIINATYDFVVQGPASNVVKLRGWLKDTFNLPDSETEKTGGGFGHVFSQTSYTGDEIPANVRAVINKNMNQNESYLSEGWESPKHTYVDKNQQKRWFKEKDVAPIYPKKAPPKLVRGYHPDMLPKLDTPIPQIKVRKKDLLRGHHLKKDEAQRLIDLVDRLNDYIKRNPEHLAYARERYPVSDPHLAALNYKMDMQLAAADEYIEKQFPENIRLYNKVLAATKKSIKLTDPKTFKSEKGVFTTFNKLARVQHVDNLYQPKERTLKLKKRGKNSVNRFLSKPKEKTKDDILKDKLAVLDKEMQKTMPDKV